MNYSGKFDAKLATDGLSSYSHDGYLHVDTVSTHAPSGAILVPDGNLLFNGDFKRAGVDLVLSRDDQHLVLHDYFKGEKRAALASPDGAHLTGDIVNALTGEVQYSQADGGAAAAAKIIGHVTKLTGSASAIRNGVSIVLNAGDNVEKGDVVQTGSDSTLGITFIDGTVFGLSHNARMVLNDMVYDPNGSNNSSLLSLVTGTISFVAGETAKHGDMKVDTPVATMGIRGTAVLVEIDFNVPAQGGVPPASFQVLVEPDGSTGSYILFDKTTLNPIATVNQAGTQTIVNGLGVVSFLATAPLSSDAQKVITDVFALKFSDLSNSQTKVTNAQTDSIVPFSFGIKLADGTTITPTIFLLQTSANSSSQSSSGPINAGGHVAGKPVVGLTENSAFSELTGVTNSSTPDSVTGLITFSDLNLGDRPTVHSIAFTSAAYQGADGNPITTFTTTEAAAINAIELATLTPVPNPANTNTGSDTWTYSLPDKSFDFLAAGEVLTLTYTADVHNNFAPNDETTQKTFTITITGTNDAPVITSPAPVVPFAAGTGTVGGDLQTVNNVATTGTLTFTDVDLTDTHTIAVALVGTTMDGSPFDLSAFPTPFAAFETALTADFATPGADSTGTGTGTITWTLAELPVFLADFVPFGETLKLTYAVTVTDEHGANSTQDVIVTIKGTDAAAVVWVATTAPGGGTTDWNTGKNWETGNVPSLTNGDDAIIITNQLQPNTPLYPVTINGPASARSVTMNDFSVIPVPPELDNNNALTIGTGGFSLNADSIVKNAAAATISVAGAMNVAGTSQVTNSGTITLAGGGTFDGQSSISNTGTGKIEISGGTLDVEVSVANAGLVTIDGSANLTLSSGAIDGGTVTNKANGEIDLTGSGVLKNGHLGNSGQIKVSGTGNSLDNETVTVNTGTIEILANGALAIDQGSTIANGGGNVTVDGTGTLTLNTATITSGTVTNKANGVVDMTGTAALKSGTLSNAGQINVSGTGNAFDGETVTVNTGTIEVLANGALTIDQTSSIANGSGNVTVDDTGTLTLNTATITSGTVTNKANGVVDMTGTAALKSGTLSNAGQINVSGTGNAFDGETVTVNTGTIEVLANGALTIDQTSSIANGSGNVTVDGTGTLTLNAATITSGTVTNKANGTVDLTGTAALKSGTLSNAGQINVSGTGNSLDGETVTVNTGTIEVLANGALAIDQTSSIANGSGNVTVDGTGTLTLNAATITSGTVTNKANGVVGMTGTAALKSGTLSNAGQINVSGTGNSLDGETVTVNTGTIEVLANGGLAIDQTSTVANGSGNVTVDGTGTLTLNAATISSGTVTNKANGVVDMTGTAALKSGTLSNAGQINVSGTGNSLDGETVTVNTGTIEVLANGALTIDQISSIANGSGNVTVDGTGALTLNTATITSGTVTNKANGVVDMTGTAALKTGTLSNAGQINVSGTGNSLDGETVTVNTGTIEVLANGGLTIDQTSTVANGSGNVTVDGTGTLTLNAATITSGTVTNKANGVVDMTGTAALKTGTLSNAGQINVSGTGNSLDGETVTVNTGTIEVLANGALTIDQSSTIANGGGNVTVDANGTLTLNASTITGGTVTNNGVLDLTGGAVIDPGSLGNSGKINVTGTGNELNDETVTSNHALEIMAGATLLIDNGSTFDNSGGTVTIDGTATLTLNSATISGGAITGSGTLDIAGTGKVDGGATLSTVAVTVESGVVLTLDGVTVSGTVITDNFSVVTDDNVKLTGGAEIKGGPITNNGTLEVSGAATLLNDTLTNTDATGSIIQVDSTDTLTLNGTDVIGGKLNNSGTVQVEATTGATLDGVTVVNIGSGNIQVDGGIINPPPAPTPITLVLEDATTITDGTLKIGNNGGVLEIKSTNGATLDDVAVTNAGIVQVDSGSLLVLKNATEVSGGTITDNGTIEIHSSAKIDGGAALNNGKMTVESGVVLTLDTVTVSGTTITDDSSIVINNNVTLKGGAEIEGASSTAKGGITNNGTLEISGTATLLYDTLTNTSATGSVIQIDGSSTLTLNGTEIIGGTITDNNSIDVTGDSKIDGSAQLNSGKVTVESGVVLTLDTVTVSGTTITDDSSIVINNNLTLKGGAEIEGASSTAKGGITNNGTLEISGTATLLYDALTNTSATGSIIQVDSTGTLTLNGTSIGGGALDNNGGTVNSTGTSSLNGVVITNSGTIESTNGTLTIDPTTVGNSGTLEANGGELDISSDPVSNTGILQAIGNGILKLISNLVTNTGSGTVNVDTGSTLDLDGGSISGGTLTNSGTLNNESGSDSISAAVTNTGTLEVTGGDLTITGSVTNSNLLLATGDSTMELSGITVANSVTTTGPNPTTTPGTVEVDADTLGSSTLDLESSTITGGIVTVAGVLDATGTSFITGADITVASTGTIESTGGGTLTIDPSPLTNSGLLLATGDSTLALSGETVTNHTGSGLSIVNGTIEVDADTLGFSTLDLESSTITGGIVTVAGLLDSTGASFITGAAVTVSGTLESTGGTLVIDATSTLGNTGTLAANGGTLVIDTAVTGNGGSAAISNGGTLEIGAGATDAQGVAFSGSGTLQLDDLSSFTGAVSGVAVGDIIDLSANAVPGGISTVAWDGSKLFVNGTQVKFSISGLAATDTFGFQTDHNGGYDLAVLAQVETAGSTGPAMGVEGQPITLNFTDALLTAAATAADATLTSFTISGIPASATVHYGNGVALMVTSDGTVTLDAAHLAAGDLTGLTITPPNDANFTLTAVATATDGAGYQYTIPTSEFVQVNPAAPTVAPVAAVGGVNQPIVLNVGTVLNQLTGDHNTLSVTISGIPDGATLDNNGHDVPAVTGGSVTFSASEIAAGILSGLSITSTNASTFALGVAATEFDAETNQSNMITGTETVVVNGLPTLTVATAQTIGVGDATKITGISLAESGITTGETFTVTLSDVHGLLSATGSNGGTDVGTGSGTNALTITGTLDQINTDLGTLKDTNGTPGTDAITVSATDSFGNSSLTPAQTDTVTVNGLPTLTVATAQTIGVGDATKIAGISLAESGITTGETFTVMLSDAHGLLSATGSNGGTDVVTGSGTNALTITGTLDQINTDLGTLKDTNGTPGTDAITVSATDSFGNGSITPAQTDTVTVNGLPTLTVPAAQSITSGQATAITGISLAESGITTGETFTVTLSDVHGLLSATGSNGGTDVVTGSGTNALTITGTLDQINTDLGTLTDTNNTQGTDAITVSATDSFGNGSITPAQTDTVTVNPASSGSGAAGDHWTDASTTDDSWSTGGNWNSDATPATGDVVYVGGSPLNPAQVFSDLTLDGNSVTLLDNGTFGAIDVISGTTLTLDDDTSITGGVTSGGILSIDGTSFLDIETGSTGSGATLDGVNVTNHGAIDISEHASGAILTLDDGTAITGGTMTVGFSSEGGGGNGTLDIEGSATLDGVTVINTDGTINVDANTQLTTLTLDDGTSIGSGALMIGPSGVLDIVAGSNGGSGATLNGVFVTDHGALDVASGAALALSGATISGGTVNLAAATPGFQSISEISVDGLDSYGPALSADGTRVVFEAADVLPGSGSQNVAIELYDSTTQQLTDVSAAVPQADLHSGETFQNLPSISADGRYVVFEGDYYVDNGFGGLEQNSDILLYDSQAQPGQQVTLLMSGAEQPVISGNGQLIAVEVDSPNNGQVAHGQSIEVLNSQTGAPLTTITGDPTYVLPSDGSDHFGNPGSVYNPSLSNGGRYVTFWSASSEIQVNGGTLFQTGNTAGTAQVYVYDRQSNTLQKVSVNNQGQQGNGDSGALTLSSDNDGTWVAPVSADGRYIVYQSSASNLVAGAADQNGVSNIFLYDTFTHTTTLVSLGVGGAAADGASYRPGISADGNYVTFSSTADNLVAGVSGDQGDQGQTYTYNIQTGAITLVSAAADGTPADSETDLASSLSADGSTVAIAGTADNLVSSTANNGSSNVYLVSEKQTAAGTLNVTANSTLAGNATVNGGALTIASGVVLTLDGATLNGTAITSNGTIDVTGSSQLENLIVAGGQITIEGGQTLTYDDVILDNVAILNDGTSVVGAGETLTYAGSDSLTSDSGSVVSEIYGHVVYTGTLALNLSSITTEGGGTITRNGGGTTLATTAPLASTNVDVTYDGYGQSGGGTGQVTFVNETAGIYDADFSGKTYIIDPGNTFTNAGLLEATNHGILLIESTIQGDSTVIANTGTVKAGAGSQVMLTNATISGGTVSTVATGTLLATGTSAILNDATLHNNGEVATSGALEISADISGSGTLEILGTGSLQIDPTQNVVSVSGQTLDFNGPGEKLTVGGAEVDSTTFGATIHSFGSGDSIDLTGVGVGDNWSFDGTTLTVLQGPTTVLATLTLAGLDSGTQFSVVGDGSGGTKITSLSEAGDQDQWNGGASGSWNAAANWIDTTAGANPANTAPGSTNFVTIGLAGDPTLDTITGTGSSAELKTIGSVDLAGQFSTGALNLYALLQLDTGNGLAVTGSAYIDASLTLDGGTLTAGSLTGENGAINLSENAVLQVAGDVTSGNSFGIDDSTFTVGGTFNENGGDIVASDHSQLQFGGLSGIPFIFVDATSSLEIGTSGGVAPGSITIDSGVTATLSDELTAPEIIDNGTIIVPAYDGLLLNGSLGGSGQIQIGNNTFLSITGGAGVTGSTATIAFDGSGDVLNIGNTALDGSLNFVTGITGFGVNDAIDFQGTVTSASFAGGVLTLFDLGVPVAYLHLSGDYTGDTFYTTTVGFDGGLGGAATQIGIVTGGDTSPAPAGTTTHDVYVWNGPVEGSWDVAGNWNDLSANQSHANVAPGVNDDVTIGAGGYVTYLTGIGNSAELTIDGSTTLAGQFATGALTLNNAGTLQLNAGDTLMVTGSASVSGIVDLNGGALTVGSLTTAGVSGQFDLSDGASLTVAGGVTNGAAFDSIYQIDGSSFTVHGTLVSNEDIIQAADGGTVQLAGLELGSTGSFGDQPLVNLTVDSNSSIEIGTSGSAAVGAVTIDTGVTTTIAGNFSAPSIVDNGTIIVAAGNSLTLSGSLSGSGQVEIDNGSNLIVVGVTAGSATTIGFEGTGGTLNILNAALDGSGNFQPAISGFGAGNTIDLSDMAYAPNESAVWQQNGAVGTLTINNGSQTAVVNLTGTYSQSDFALTQDSFLGTDIILPAAGVAAAVSTGNIALVSQELFGASTESQGAAVTYADGHLYLSYNNGAQQTANTGDTADIVAFNTATDGAAQTFTYAWGYGDFAGIAADGGQIYAAGESTPYYGLTSDNPPGIETKGLFVRFDTDGVAHGDPTPAEGYTANTFYPYSGVEEFYNIVATTQGGNTILYAFGFGQPNGVSDTYMIGEYDSNGTLLHTAVDTQSTGSVLLGATGWNGSLWAVGETLSHPTVWDFSYDLSTVTAYQDMVGSVAGQFNSVATIGSALYAAGGTNGGQYLIADYNANGSVAWSETFGSGTLNGAVTIDGDLYVVGTASNGEGVLMEINTSNGSVISTQTYDAGAYNSFTSVTTDGHYLYVGGVSGASSSSDQAVLLTYDIGGATATTVEDTAVTLHSLAVSDAAAGSNDIEVTLAAGHGTLTLENTDGLSVASAGDSVELTGSQSAINAALAHGVVYDPTGNYTGSDTLTVTVDDQGHNSTGSPISTTQTVGITVAPADTIAAGGSDTITGPSGETVVFASNTGSLVINDPTAFTGQVSGFTGTAPDAQHSDTIDLVGIDRDSGSFTDSYNTTTGLLTVSDGAHTASFTLADFNGTLDFVTDNSGGTLILDPPKADPAPNGNPPATTGGDQFFFKTSLQGPNSAPSDDHVGLTHNVPWMAPTGTNDFGNHPAPTQVADALADASGNPNVDTMLKHLTLAGQHAGDFHFTTG